MVAGGNPNNPDSARNPLSGVERVKGHTVAVTFEAKWGPSATLFCHHNRMDSKRPCWPHTENGQPEDQAEGERIGCVYYEWFANDGLESLGGPDVTVRFDLAEAEWDGDGFTFVLGQLQTEQEADRG